MPPPEALDSSLFLLSDPLDGLLSLLVQLDFTGIFAHEVSGVLPTLGAQPEGSEMAFLLQFCRSLLAKVKVSQRWKLKADLLWFMGLSDREVRVVTQKHSVLHFSGWTDDSGN